jgi:hypothetical protein
MTIIAPRPDYTWSDEMSEADNVGQLIQIMDETEDRWGGYVYDYYSMAHWVLTFVNENTWEVGP